MTDTDTTTENTTTLADVKGRLDRYYTLSRMLTEYTGDGYIGEALLQMAIHIDNPEHFEDNLQGIKNYKSKRLRCSQDVHPPDPEELGLEPEED